MSCDSSYWWLETIVTNIPPLVFFLTAIRNWLDIEHLGYNKHYYYSLNFNIKRFCVMSQVLLNFSGIIISLLSVKPFGLEAIKDQYISKIGSCYQNKIASAISLICVDLFQLMAWALSY